MATDATGTPTTNLSIPKYDPSVDAPSGLGFNAAMDFIDTLINGRAALASPTFTGTPIAPTASPGTNTTQLATTAFVAAALSGITGIAKVNEFVGAGATADFTSIPGTYRHLLLVGKSHIATPASYTLGLRFNNDSGGTSYVRQHAAAQAAVITPAENLGESAMNIIAGNSNYGPTAFFLFIPDYAIASYTGADAHSVVGMALVRQASLTATGALDLRIVGGAWKATGAAINRITIIPSTSTWNTSIFTLYGIS